MQEFQFYPTPYALAVRAWKLFKNTTFTRVLDPSAGEGDLVKPFSRYQSVRNWDAIEIDPSKHGKLREAGGQVVGYDFLSHTSCAIYSHIIMNPPFMYGAQHVLHAWRTLYSGEIVAILNAETIRNPFSADRQQLVQLVEEFGHVEFVRDAFKGEDVTREANVEVALIHLVKLAHDSNIFSELIDSLKTEDTASNALDWETPTELAIPEGFVEQTVRHFNLAVKAEKEAAVAVARASHYRARLGQTMEMLQSQDERVAEQEKASLGRSVRDTFAETYGTLKNAAWTQILNSTHVFDRLSSAARARAEAEFNNIKQLEFTCPNVYGFLQGLVQSSGTIQAEMMCDVFDQVTRYHTENTVFFMGWKSNDNHRTGAYRIKRTRFILPNHGHDSWYTTAKWETQRLLADFDKVFALLDGKVTPNVSLEHLFGSKDTFARLLAGERLASDYFEVRFFPRRGTIHFFPVNMEVIERLNRFVGRLRKWLPPTDEQANADFHYQYNQAEKLQDALFGKLQSHSSSEIREMNGLFFRNDEETRDRAQAALYSALEAVLHEKGLHPFEQIEQSTQLKLLMA